MCTHKNIFICLGTSQTTKSIVTLGNGATRCIREDIETVQFQAQGNTICLHGVLFVPSLDTLLYSTRASHIPHHLQSKMLWDLPRKHGTPRLYCYYKFTPWKIMIKAYGNKHVMKSTTDSKTYLSGYPSMSNNIKISSTLLAISFLPWPSLLSNMMKIANPSGANREKWHWETQTLMIGPQVILCTCHVHDWDSSYP